MKRPGTWGRRFLEALELCMDRRHLSRGKQYLGSRKATDWRVRDGVAEARMRGRVNPYYGMHEDPVFDTRLSFPPAPDSAWEEAIRRLGARAGFVSRLLFNEMPDAIETPLAEMGVSLLPRGPAELRVSCTCNEPDPPCRHIAGLCLLLGARLDQDPLLLFELRGLPRAELVRRLAETPLGSALAAALNEESGAIQPAESYFTRPVPLPPPEEIVPRDFWRGGKRLPSGIEPREAAAVSGILIRKGGDHPPFWDRTESFGEVMAQLYEQVRKRREEI